MRRENRESSDRPGLPRDGKEGLGKGLYHYVNIGVAFISPLFVAKPIRLQNQKAVEAGNLRN